MITVQVTRTVLLINYLVEFVKKSYEKFSLDLHTKNDFQSIINMFEIASYVFCFGFILHAGVMVSF